MDPGATVDPASSSTSTLRKRLASIDTSRRGDGPREPAAPRPERESKARQGHEQEASSMAPAEEQVEADQAAGRDVEAGEPMSPAGRLFRETHFNCYIVAVIGLGSAVDVAAVRAGLEATLVRHPRFCSVQVLDDVKKEARPRWVRTTVNLDDHIIFPHLDPTTTSANPDLAVEDYLSSLSTKPMDHSYPLWEFHILDFPTSEAAATVAVRMHHSLGDGISLLSLLIACTRSAADPARLPELRTAPRRSGPVHARPRPPLSAGFAALVVWAWSYVVLAWHTLVDVARFVATSWFLRDARTPFMGSEGVEFRRKRFVHRTLSLDDVKFVKNAMKCTVNDVLIGVTSAGMSRYYFRKTSDADSKRKTSQQNICVRSALLVNIRKTPGLHALAEMMDSSKHNNAKWGNQIGYIILPFHIAMHDDPLEYIRQGKRTAERKKASLEAVFTYWSGNLIIKLFGIKVAAALCYGMFTNTTMSFSSMVGPDEKVELRGHPIVYIAPSVYGHPHALTVHYQSYMNSVKLVLAVDDAQFPDSHQLLDDFYESLRLIRQAASIR
ncbi:wax ester synthase/diacylglycerol acyltransferase 11-like [Phragmites australis]|uniref:wax ester synthase/diacylglycerol acyltransferase 11-like n=1 Tax=Phragmites australis TaxID=29695 RepID=UPI002D795E56|nr:wax ester synthase/diacylglycerol acyltransferase 11-like [Phragmites australis]